MDEGIIRQLSNLLSEASGIMWQVKEDQPTLRDRFAMAALAGLLADPSPEREGTFQEFAADAYGFADAMLKAREPKP